MEKSIILVQQSIVQMNVQKLYIISFKVFRLCISMYVCTEHREHGNRIMHEFLLGQRNITRDLPRPKPDECG